MSSLNAALALAERGFPIFPIKAGEKTPPLVQDWPAAATTDRDRITAWWGKSTPYANIGIHCIGLIVIDVDPRKGGNESLLGIDLRGTVSSETLPPTLESSTPSGGTHLFYRLPAGHPGVPNRVNALGPGLDIRSTGGYVVGAGSRTANGRYEWRNPDTPIADAPGWLLDALGKAPERKAAPDIPDAAPTMLERAQAWLDERAGAVEGQGGDNWTFVTAAFLRDYGLSQAQTLELMTGWNAKCSPPWEPSDLAAKVRSAYKSATGEPGAKSVTADDFPTVAPDPAPEPKKTKARPIPLSEFSGQAATGGSYLVKGLLYSGTYAEVYGEPGQGKTFVALDMAYHVADGREWMGRRAKQGVVLYVGFEAFGGLGNRARALRQRYEKDAPLYFVPGDFNLRLPEGRQAFGTIMAALPETPKLIVFDTFAYALAGGDENSAQDVGAFNTVVQRLIEKTGACVLLIHHSGKDATKGARGSSALRGAVDTEIEISDRIIQPTKQRDVELGEPIGFKLLPVAVGIDDDGDIITSCVVEEAAIQTPQQRPKRGTTEERVWGELCDRRPLNEPIGVLELRDYCAVFLPRGDTKLRQAFYDALKALAARGWITVDETTNTITRVME